MSQTESNSGDETITQGPNVTTNFAARETRDNASSAAIPTRNWWDGSDNLRRFLGDQAGQRKLYEAIGYETTLKPGHYIGKWQRGPGIAGAIIDKPVNDCWGGKIEIEETEDTDEEETDFEKEAKYFLKGAYTRVQPRSRFKAADRWARLLEYSLILIGVRDGNVEEGEEASLKEEVDSSGLKDLGDIDYLSVIDQRRVDWDGTSLVDDPTDERYNLPETYSVDLGGDDGETDVHHSRIVHVVEDPGENELKSPSALKGIYNRLDDVEKLLAGSGEMFWRGAWPGLVLTPPKDSDGVPIKFEDDGEGVAEQISNYRQNLNRLHRVTGDLKKLDTNIAPPEGHTKVQYEDISAHVDIPMSILRGNETGERATGEDRKQYHEFLRNRRNDHCKMQIIRPLFERFIEWGIMTPPKSGDVAGYYLFDINFPSLDEPSELELSEIALNWARAFKEISGGSPQKIASIGERRKKGLDMDAEYGSEAKDVPDEDQLAAQGPPVPDEGDNPENVPPDSEANEPPSEEDEEDEEE